MGRGRRSGETSALLRDVLREVGVMDSAMKAWLVDGKGNRELVLVPVFWDTVVPEVPFIVSYKGDCYLQSETNPLTYVYRLSAGARSL